MKLWGGRFSKHTSQLVDEYNASIGFDYQLATYDIEGSLAHVRMLGHCQLISEEEQVLICAGLLRIQEKITCNAVDFSVSDEDIHMNIERLLHEDIGPVAGKLHTGRSRNDQVALDMHLYLRHHVVGIVRRLADFLEVIHTLAAGHIDTVIPGYTHLQRAEPLRFAHHLLAYFNMFSRDVARLCDSFPRINRCPLGAGALAGSGLAVDREYVADLLRFDGVYTNSLDAVSDRDFVVEFMANASLIMMHLSRLSEELILWSSHEFAFVQLDDAFCTGSSMMPQKKNPDVCELARGKTGRVYGALMGVLSMLKALPMAYNKDMQEDKEGLFDVVKTLSKTLEVYTPMLASMQINQSRMRQAAEQDYANATNLANYLVAKGVPFREAHEICGKLVRYGLEHQQLLSQLELPVFRQFSAYIDEDVYQVLTLEAVVEAHQATGGTARQCVQQQLDDGRVRMQDIQDWLTHHSPD